MRFTKYITPYAFLFFFLPALPLMAQTGYPEFERDLQLSESQRMHVEETKKRYMDELLGLKQESINKRLELRELDRHPTGDPERRERLQRELGAIDSTRHNLYNQYRSDVSRILNQEQRNRYNNFVDTERRGAVNRPAPADRPTALPPPSAYRSQPAGPPVVRPQGPAARPPAAPPFRGHGR